MKILATGFVQAGAGSIAGSNALLLGALLDAGCEIAFFSKPSFVDPRPAAGGRLGLSFHDTSNRVADAARRLLAPVPGLRHAALALDVATYNRLLVREMGRHPGHADACLWLGDYARGRSGSIPHLSFAQGPPGTDARSVLARTAEISRLAGLLAAWKWRMLARLRLSPFGLPNFAASDLILVGSEQSRNTLARSFGCPREKTRAVPYAIDLARFSAVAAPRRDGPLRVLWLGRIVPRKRLDLFLDAAARAINAGVDLRITIAGAVGFIRGYESLIAEFPHPGRLRREQTVPREQVPALLADHDLLAQPSEEEDFGSSVAEAQACGIPVVVGATNGNADYLCERDTRLAEQSAAALVRVFADYAQRKAEGRLGDPRVSRNRAESLYSPALVARRVIAAIEETIAAR